MILMVPSLQASGSQLMHALHSHNSRLEDSSRGQATPPLRIWMEVQVRPHWQVQLMEVQATPPLRLEVPLLVSAWMPSRSRHCGSGLHQRGQLQPPPRLSLRPP